MHEYPHMLFKRHWHLTDKVMYQLGQCEAIVAAISRTPILPEYHQILLSVSLRAPNITRISRGSASK